MWDLALELCKVVVATQGAKASEILLNLIGWSDGTDLDPDAERSPDEPMFGAIGVLTKPLPADADGSAEVWASRQGDGLTPIAGRDLRISKARGPIKEGSVNLAGYRGAFVAFEPAPSGDGAMFVVYVPFEFDSAGVPAKAHTLQFDTTPGSEAVLLAHSTGACWTINKDGQTVIASPNGENFLAVGDDGVATSGQQQFPTSVSVGNPAAAFEAVIAPPGSAAWFVQVDAAVKVMALAFNVAGPLTGAPGTTVPPVAPFPVVSTMLKASVAG